MSKSKKHIGKSLNSFGIMTQLHKKLDLASLKRGDKVAHVWNGLAVYAIITMDCYAKVLIVNAFSVACPEGEHGSLERSLITTKLTDEEWDYCESAGWPNDGIAHNMIRSNHSP